MFWPFRMQISNAFGSLENTLNKLCLFKIPQSSFTITGKKIKSYCRGTELKKKTKKKTLLARLMAANMLWTWMHVYILSHYHGISQSRTIFFQVNLIHSSTSARNNTCIFTDFAGELCDHLTDEETQRRRERDHSWLLALTILSFCEKSGKSVDQSERAIFKSAISKQNQTSTLHQGWLRCNWLISMQVVYFDYDWHFAASRLH